MTVVTSHQPGSFCWIELGTSDAKAARDFYTNLFGWTVNENDMGSMIYYIFQKSGKDCAAMYQIDEKQQGMPPNWATYVAVASADESAEKAKSLGANLMMPPFDVADHGRMCFMSDPQGAMFAIWQAKSHIGVGIRDEANTLCWNELHALDLDAAKKFYPALFGWTVKDSPDYTEWHLDGRGIGGMIKSHAPEGAPSYWIPYFMVDDCDATVNKAQAGGAVIYVPPQDIEKVGRFAVLADPQGAMFALIKVMM